jgi:hypothetical protein
MIKLIDLMPTLNDDEMELFAEGLEIDPNVDLNYSDSHGKSMFFDMEDKKYEVRVDIKMTADKKKIGEFKFYLLNSPKLPQRKNFDNDQQYLIALQKSQIGITGTGNAFHIFSKVLSIMIKYCKENDIDYITFVVDEENRQSLYKKILEKLVKKYNLPYKLMDVNPINGSKLSTEEFWLTKI